MSLSKQEAKRCWFIVNKILNENKDGIETNTLYSLLIKDVEQRNNKLSSSKQKIPIYSKKNLSYLINNMRKQHRLISFLSNTVIKIRDMNRGQTLKKLDENSNNVYDIIELSENKGIQMSHIKTRLKTTQQTSIINKCLKTLEKSGLISSYVNNKSQKLYISTQYTPPTKNVTIFHNPNNDIDYNFVDAMCRIVFLILKEYGYNGCNIGNIIEKIINKKIIKTSKKIRYHDIECVLNILRMTNKIELIPSTIDPDFITENIDDINNTTFYVITLQNKLRFEYNIKSKKEDKIDIKQIKNHSFQDNKLFKTFDEEPPKKRRKIEPKYENYTDISIKNDENKDIKMKDDKKDLKTELFGHNIHYRTNNYSYISTFTQIPCLTCPVSQNCGENNVINPAKCVYLNDWLDL